MVVLDLDVVRIAIGELERHAPASIHRHGPLSPPRSGQRMKSNSLQDTQRPERFRSVKCIKEHQCPIVIQPAESSPTPVLHYAPSVDVLKCRNPLEDREAGLTTHMSGMLSTGCEDTDGNPEPCAERRARAR